MNGHTETVIYSFYHHTLYGDMVGYIVVPVLEAMAMSPAMFDPLNRTEDDLFSFLLTATSYNLSEGVPVGSLFMRD